MTESSDNESLQRELEALRKRVAWIGKAASTGVHMEFLNLLTPVE